MFSGESVFVKMKTYAWMMDSLVDWFGKDFNIVEKKDDKMIISVKCNEEAIIFWAMQYGRYATVLEPEDIRRKIRENVEYMLVEYGAV